VFCKINSKLNGPFSTHFSCLLLEDGPLFLKLWERGWVVRYCGKWKHTFAGAHKIKWLVVYDPCAASWTALKWSNKLQQNHSVLGNILVVCLFRKCIKQIYKSLSWNESSEQFILNVYLENFRILQCNNWWQNLIIADLAHARKKETSLLQGAQTLSNMPPPPPTTILDSGCAIDSCTILVFPPLWTGKGR
jgi:hypothetical protein